MQPKAGMNNPTNAHPHPPPARAGDINPTSGEKHIKKKEKETLANGHRRD